MVNTEVFGIWGPRRGKGGGGEGNRTPGPLHAKRIVPYLNTHL